MQAKDGQNFKKCEAISGGIIGEGGYFFMSMKLGMADTSFKGNQKGGCGCGNTSLCQRQRRLFTKRSVERIENDSNMNTRHFSREEKAMSSTDNAWDGGTSYKADGTDEMCHVPKRR